MNQTTLPPFVKVDDDDAPAARSAWIVLWLALGITLATAGVIITNAVPWLLGPAPFPPEWLWPWELLSFEKVQTWAHLLGTSLYLALAILLLSPYLNDAEGRRRVGCALALAVIGFLGLQLLLGWARKESLLDMVIFRTYAPPGNGYFMSAVRVESIGDTLRNYQAAMPNFPHDRPQTHPPGIFAYYGAWITLFRGLPDFNAWFAPIARSWALEGRDWVLLQDAYVSAAFFSGWTQLILGGFAPLAFYKLLQRLDARRFDARQSDAHQSDAHGLRGSTFALAGALALPLLPSVNSFYTHWDVNYLLLTSAAWWLALRAQDRFNSGDAYPAARWLEWFWPGLMLFLLTWLSFGNAVFVGIVGLHLLWRQAFVMPRFTGNPWHHRWWGFVLGGALMALGLALPWVVAWLVWGMNYFGLLSVGMARHYVIATAGRDLSIWIWMNLVDFALWIGFGLSLLAAAAGVWLIANRRAGWREANLSGMAIVFVVVLLALDLSGSARAEIGRLWLFLMPIPLILALAWQRTWKQRALILVMLAITAWSMGFAVRAV